MSGITEKPQRRYEPQYDDRSAEELTAARAHPHCPDCRLVLEDCRCAEEHQSDPARVQSAEGSLKTGSATDTSSSALPESPR